MQGAIAASVGGEVSVTSDYIYRGLSESAGHAAVQVDLHASSAAGTFVGAWGSTRDHKLDPEGDYEVMWGTRERSRMTFRRRPRPCLTWTAGRSPSRRHRTSCTTGATIV
ncbi:MAG: hypothetical protein E6K49_11725 [Gammaproteobacteria bacterium]|nr:MAG: hypothetical protein E6K49_11725 [Gammaproteobacteria bacterium]